MLIERITSVEDIPMEEVARHLVVDEGGEVNFLQQLAGWLANMPEKVFMLLVWNNREKEELRAFVIAHDPGMHVDYSYIAQVWSDPQNNRKVTTAMFARLWVWTVAMGKTAIRGMTQRNEDAIFRSFGFENVGIIVERKIEAGERKGLFGHVKDVLHG